MGMDGMSRAGRHIPTGSAFRGSTGTRESEPKRTFERLYRALFLYPKMEVTDMTVRRMKPSKEALETKVAHMGPNGLTQKAGGWTLSGITEQAMSDIPAGQATAQASRAGGQ